MSNEPIANERFFREAAVTERFLERPNEDSFADLFKTFTPQLVAFFRARSCELALAEDLTQEVMLIVYSKASQFEIAHCFVHGSSRLPATLSAGTMPNRRGK